MKVIATAFTTCTIALLLWHGQNFVSISYSSWKLSSIGYIGQFWNEAARAHPTRPTWRPRRNVQRCRRKRQNVWAALCVAVKWRYEADSGGKRFSKHCQSQQEFVKNVWGLSQGAKLDISDRSWRCNFVGVCCAGRVGQSSLSRLSMPGPARKTVSIIKRQPCWQSEMALIVMSMPNVKKLAFLTLT